MPPSDLSPLRRSQVVGAYGPGAVVDFRAGPKGGSVSVVTAGLDAWDERTKTPGLGHPQVIFEPRLQHKLHVEGFRLPPVTPEVAPGVPAKNADKLLGVRFPIWLQCPHCRLLKRAQFWDPEAGSAAPTCRVCSDNVGSRVFPVPVRFIVACENGHLDEFPWERWLDHAPSCSRRGKLKLEATEVPGLAGLVLVCLECQERRGMEGCFSTKGLIAKCAGKRPWLPADPETDCRAEVTVVQRGASNLYFPVVHSALDIPPWSDRVQKVLESHWQSLVSTTDPEDRKSLIRILKLHERVGLGVEELVKLVEDRVRLLEDPSRESIRWEEWTQLTRHDIPFGAHEELEGRPEPVPDEIRPWIHQITVLTRLREVRAIQGFTRISPPAGERDPRIAPIAAKLKTWLPAIEVRGEGVFLSLPSESLARWENHPDVVERTRSLADLYKKLRGDRDDRDVTPRLLLLHSLAHALLRQLSLECGYSASSLRERLYVGAGAWDMAGLLIYTASADADGTLGGLARQGRADALLATLSDALRGLSWCSSDPLCIEGRASLSHQLNLAACHACMLASETSCEEFNILLDRALLVGTPSKPHVGFFRSFLDGLDNEGL